MSFFPIPIEKFGTKHKQPEIKLTKENIKQRKESIRRAHTIKDAKKNSIKMDEVSKIKIKDIQNLVKRFGDNINLISAKCVQEQIFDNAITARIFITSFKEKIFSS